MDLKTGEEFWSSLLSYFWPFTRGSNILIPWLKYQCLSHTLSVDLVYNQIWYHILKKEHKQNLAMKTLQRGDIIARKLQSWKAQSRFILWLILIGEEVNLLHLIFVCQRMFFFFQKFNDLKIDWKSSTESLAGIGQRGFHCFASFWTSNNLLCILSNQGN